MIDHFIEKSLLRKLTIVDILSTDNLDINQLAEKMEVSRLTIISDLEEMDGIFSYGEGGKFHINYDHFKNGADIKEMKHMFYQRSTFVEMLVFYLRNNILSHTAFSSDGYLSTTNFYQLRRKIIKYFEKIDLKFGKKGIQGDEIRIRFFYAYLQMKTGAKLIDEKLYGKWKRVIETTIERYKIALSDHYIEMGALLLAIGQERKDKPLKLDNEIVQKIKDVTFYSLVKQLATEGKISLDDISILYAIIVINFLDANSDKKVFYDMDVSPRNAFIYNDHAYSLIEKISQKFQFESQSFLAFVVFNFIKKAFLNLQEFIPENKIYIDNPAYKKFYNEVVGILDEWNKETGSNLLFSYAYLDRFVLQLSQTLLPKTNKLIKVVANSYFDYFVIEQQINKVFKGYQFEIDKIVYTNVDAAIDHKLSFKEYIIVQINDNPSKASKAIDNLIIIPLYITDRAVSSIRTFLEDIYE